ncbi:hypothetical protein [Isoalcanivorax beigongshangi]|uniref:Transmembrane protein n=1 Tax=Isoalcanivorax beigongshangi TaxID=3238810 RepID=A0ABV4AHJ0_9GAMM
MTEQGYMVAWLAYLGAAFVVLVVMTLVAQRWHRWVKYPFIAILVGILFTPWPVAADSDNLGPAWIITLFEALIQKEANPLRAGAPLLAAVVLCLVVATVQFAIRRRR